MTPTPGQVTDEIADDVARHEVDLCGDDLGDLDPIAFWEPIVTLGWAAVLMVLGSLVIMLIFNAIPVVAAWAVGVR